MGQSRCKPLRVSLNRVRKCSKELVTDELETTGVKDPQEVQDFEKIQVMKLNQDDVWNRHPKGWGYVTNYIILYIVCLYICARMFRVRAGARLVTSI